MKPPVKPRVEPSEGPPGLPPADMPTPPRRASSKVRAPRCSIWSWVMTSTDAGVSLMLKPRRDAAPAFCVRFGERCCWLSRTSTCVKVVCDWAAVASSRACMPIMTNESFEGFIRTIWKFGKFGKLGKSGNLKNRARAEAEQFKPLAALSGWALR